MHVANLELCKELYELSGWRETYAHYWNESLSGPLADGNTAIEWAVKTDYPGYTPAYDLGYLLRKLELHEPNLSYLKGSESNPWPDHYFQWRAYLGFTGQLFWADNPEDAACKLAIELFKQGMLTRES